jgi:hypothetical protein
MKFRCFVHNTCWLAESLQLYSSCARPQDDLLYIYLSVHDAQYITLQYTVLHPLTD